MTLLIIYIHDQSSISRLKSVHVHINPPSTNDPQMHLTVHMIWQFFCSEMYRLVFYVCRLLPIMHLLACTLYEDNLVSMEVNFKVILNVHFMAGAFIL